MFRRSWPGAIANSSSVTQLQLMRWTIRVSHLFRKLHARSASRGAATARDANQQQQQASNSRHKQHQQQLLFASSPCYYKELMQVLGVSEAALVASLEAADNLELQVLPVLITALVPRLSNLAAPPGPGSRSGGLTASGSKAAATAAAPSSEQQLSTTHALVFPDVLELLLLVIIEGGLLLRPAEADLHDVLMMVKHLLKRHPQQAEATEGLLGSRLLPVLLQDVLPVVLWLSCHSSASPEAIDVMYDLAGVVAFLSIAVLVAAATVSDAAGW
eukprot:gene10808-10964_t